MGEGKGGNACPRTPWFWKTPTGFHGWVDLLIDDFVTELKKKTIVLQNIQLEGKKTGFHVWVDLLIDDFVTELKKTIVLQNIRLEGKKKSNFSCGLTVH